MGPWGSGRLTAGKRSTNVVFESTRGAPCMTRLRRIYLVRHGETEGESSTRYHGSNDVALSALGRAQMADTRLALPIEGIAGFVSSPLKRAWQAARILAPNSPVRLEAGFREIDFGRWEGLTREEIAERDPALFRRWSDGEPGFEYPEGERRAEFRARVRGGLERTLALPLPSVLVVAHKGVVRTLVEELGGSLLPPTELELAGWTRLRRNRLGDWIHVSDQALRPTSSPRRTPAASR